MYGREAAPESCPTCHGPMHEWPNHVTGASALICQREGCPQPNLYRMPTTEQQQQFDRPL